MTSDTEYVQGVERAFAVIKAFTGAEPALTIAQVAQHANLTRAVARRYLLTLKKLGYVHQDGARFFLTPRLLDLGHAYLVTLNATDVAKPYLERIMKRLPNAESSSMAVLDGHDCVYVERAFTRRIISSNLAIGSRLPAHAVALGKVLLAYLSPNELENYFKTAALERHTSRTICDANKLRRVLRKIRSDGWGFADEEFVVGRRTIAAPIFDRQGRVTLAINVAAAVALVSTREMLEEQLPVLLESAREISFALGAKVEDVSRLQGASRRPHSPAEQSAAT